MKKLEFEQMKYSRLKAACYMTNISMSVVGNLSPLLFVTFRETYGISYTLLGLLVLINFSTQLIVDLVFSFFSNKFNIPLVVRLTPLLSVVGLIIYSASPLIFPGNAYVGLVIGTMIFSASSGFAEVLISPVIAAIPSEHPDREMSKLHSIYAWGVVGVVVFATLFLFVFTDKYWQILPIVFALIPATSFVLFSGCKIPTLTSDDQNGERISLLVKRGVLFFVMCIFLGGACECIMSQWCSGFIEKALGIEKIWGDVLGVAMFGAALGFGRSLYAKVGKNIMHALIPGALGAAICYLTAAFSPYSALALAACALTGFCTSMLWPGSLILVSDKIPGCGVAVFALMAAGGDMGASIGPQLVGVITDGVMSSEAAADMAIRYGMGIEELAMKTGMMVSALFPICAVATMLFIVKKFGGTKPQ